MQRNETIGLRSILITLAGSNTAAYIAGRYVDNLIPEQAQFNAWMVLGLVILVICLIYYGAYKLIERFIEARPLVAEQTAAEEVLIKAELHAITDAADAGKLNHLFFWKSAALVFLFERFPIYTEIIRWLDELNAPVSQEVYEIKWAPVVPDRETRVEIYETLQTIGLAKETNGYLSLVPDGKDFAKHQRQREEESNA